eukprot:TRINITY_DN25599_c0_g1_i1.p1 TRINITY_DN25599_c0_g1~~TRINITY_DN25599_c0_g1_i1.p1  ORF type:complete len:450 (+),score=61.24 TRINITY_DN25599_c0_g1_i1:36-1352(+)
MVATATDTEALVSVAEDDKECHAALSSKRWLIAIVGLLSLGLCSTVLYLRTSSSSLEVAVYGGRSPSELHLDAKERRVRMLLDSRINHRAVRQAMCAIDVQEVVFRLMDGSVNVANAVEQECKHAATNVDQERCAAVIMNAIWAYTRATACIAAAVSDCAKQINKRAECAAVVQHILASLEIIGGGSLWADLACHGEFMHPYDGRRLGQDAHSFRRTSQSLEAYYPRRSENSSHVASAQWPPLIPHHGRLLHAKRHFDRVLSTLPAFAANDSSFSGVMGLNEVHDPAGHHVNKGRVTTECITQASLVAVYLQRAAVSITHSVTNCAKESVTGREGKVTCSAGIIDLLGELAVVAAFLSAVTNSCAEVAGHGNEPGVCGYGSAAIVAGVFEATAEGMDIKKDCTMDSDMKKTGVDETNVSTVRSASPFPDPQSLMIKPS